MAAIAALGQVASYSYVHVSGERDMKPFSGEVSVDGHSVEDFIEEVECVVRARDLKVNDQ